MILPLSRLTSKARSSVTSTPSRRSIRTGARMTRWTCNTGGVSTLGVPWPSRRRSQTSRTRTSRNGRTSSCVGRSTFWCRTIECGRSRGRVSRVSTTSASTRCRATSAESTFTPRARSKSSPLCPALFQQTWKKARVKLTKLLHQVSTAGADPR